MPRLNSSIETRRMTDVAYLIVAAGRLDESQTSLLEDELLRIIDRSVSEVVVELTHIEDVEPGALDVLERAAKCLRLRGGTLLLAVRESGTSYQLEPVEPNAAERLRGLHPALDAAITERVFSAVEKSPGSA